MDKPPRNTLSAIDAALADLDEKGTADSVPAEWKTVDEWSRLQNKSNTTTSRKLRKLVNDGRWEQKLFRISTGERIYPVPHYRKKP